MVRKNAGNPGHANIPLFIPHLGCPHRCVFCDQNAISGSRVPDEAEVRETIERSLLTLRGRNAEIAFFGGSFTAIGKADMIALLSAVQPYLKSGAVAGVRLSTRPDAVSEDVLDTLEEYGVTAIELGVQSMDDAVLAAARRGHTAKDVEDAFARITARGRYSLTGQMMLGLPRSDPEKELFTARRICEMGADGARIYPTVVLAGTTLEKQMNDGSYAPLTLEEGVRRGAQVCRVFERHGVRLLRMGLCAEESCARAVVGGCYHPAYGELVRSRLFLEDLTAYFENNPPTKGKTYIVATAKRAVSAAVGCKRQNKEILQERYRCRLVFTGKEDLDGREFRIEEG